MINNNPLCFKKLLYKNRDIITIIFLIIIMISLFRGFLDYGMEFDEVLRKNNVMVIINDQAEPYEQSIFDLKIGNLKIPLMYKEYISSTETLIWIPLIFFNDLLLGVRILYILYSIISIIALYYVCKKHSFYLAFFTLMLIVTNPILYPDIAFGSSSIRHLIILSLVSIFVYKYYNEAPKKIYLFLASFVLFLGVNIKFYFIWSAVAILVASSIIYPDYWKKIIKSPKEILPIIAGMLLGSFNFIYYNIATGFPTIRKLFLSIFNTQKYNETPIDYVELGSFSEELQIKIRNLSTLLGDYSYLYLLIFIAIFFLNVLFLITIIRNKKFKKNRIYFLSFLSLMLVLTMIIVSPKARNAYHFNYVLPFWELSIMCIILQAKEIFTSSRYKNAISKTIFFVPVIILLINFISSNKNVESAHINHGEGFFSPAIFELKEYLTEEKIMDEEVAFIHWGFHSQLYFLSKGEYKINSIVFQLMGKTDEERFDAIEEFFLKIENKEKIYFPIYSDRFQEETEAFLSFIEVFGGRKSIVEEFYEKDGRKVYELLVLENVQEIKQRIARDIAKEMEEKEVYIYKVHPNKIKAGQPFNPQQDNISAIALEGENFMNGHTIYWNDVPLMTVFGGKDVLTGLVPAGLFNDPGKVELRVVFEMSGVKILESNVYDLYID